MLKKEEIPCLLYCIPDKKFKKIVNDYIDYVMNPYHEWRQTEEWQDEEFNNGFSMGNKPAPERYEHLPEKQPLRQRGEFDGRAPKYQLEHQPQRKRTEYAFYALIDMLYRLYEQSINGWFTISKSVLANVFYDSYPYMLTALSKHCIILGEGKLTSIWQPELFELRSWNKADYNSIISYRLRAVQVLDKYNKKEATGIVNRLKSTIGDDAERFLSTYKKHLALVAFPDTNAVSKYLNDWRYFKSEKRKLYYRTIVNKANTENGYLNEEKTAIIMGENESSVPIGRIYHIGTFMPKSLKKYSTLQYGIDAHNSHPLLFNLFLYDYYINENLFSIYDNFLSIDLSPLYYSLSSSIIKYNPYSSNHYVLEYLYNQLKINKIEEGYVDKIMRMPSDIFRYIYDTSTGRIWDTIHNSFSQYSRSEVKENCFKYVFYSYPSKVEKKRQEKWTTLFKSCYPSVWNVINEYKSVLHEECKKEKNVSITNNNGIGRAKDTVLLPHLLMRLEAVIFTRALNDAFKEKIPAIGIHDCLAIVGNSNTIDINQQQRLIDILNKHYKSVGLIPSLGIEEYHK